MKSTCRLELTMPPMLGAAMGFMISIPAPVANITGKSDRTIAPTVINFGRRRAADPSMTASTYDCPSLRWSSAARMKITMMIPVWTATANSEIYPTITAVVIA